MANKSAFVAVVGRPSVGKSTLINLLCGQKVAIVSAVPQTTRNAIRGIVNRPQGQLVFVDTPGRHASEKKLNKKLMAVSDRAVAEAELALYMLDASRPPGAEEDVIARDLAPLAETALIAAINKMDARGAGFDGARSFLKLRLPNLPDSRIFGISALKNEGTEELLRCLFDLAGEGENLYPEGYYTDQDLDFRIAEIIREKAINRLYEELPHSLYVEVADTELHSDDKDPSKTRLWIRAFIITERDSQKGMVVGKSGEMIKAIRQAAQKDLNRILDWKVELDLRVKSSHEWRRNDKVLRRLISGE
ncbi:MAG: GTPase Era [Treponema sp.]|jgi:GTP-binding protein Era|nr:GTPase Era [Treponema sp.]